MSNYRVEQGEYKGSKTITIFDGERRVISFGLTKAKAILSSVDDIENFVLKNTKKETVNEENFQELLLKSANEALEHVRGENEKTRTNYEDVE